MTVCAPAAVSVELLRFEPQSRRTAVLFEALTDAARKSGVEITDTRTYRGRSDWLLLWGAGSPLRWPAMAAQLAAGKHYVTCDLAYWSRYEKFRVSIDSPHPQAWVMKKDWPASRFMADKVAVSDDWDQNGPVVVAGLGDKARVQYGAGVVDAWEAGMMAECKRRGWPVQYRAKPKGGAAVPIERVLNGARLLATWHSNAAIDAIRLGIPVVCRDGAAAAIYGSELSEKPSPVAPSVRNRFLINLSFFQWRPDEAVQMWAFLKELLST